MFFFDNLKALPKSTPAIITPTTDIMVNIMPSLPDSTAEYRFMPKPRPTTDACKRYLEVFLEKTGYGDFKVRAKAIPSNNANAGEMKKDAAKSSRNKILESTSLFITGLFMDS